MLALSEESKERIGKIMDVSRVALHYGYLPLVLYLGTTLLSPKPLLSLCDIRFLLDVQATPSASPVHPSFVYSRPSTERSQEEQSKDVYEQTSFTSKQWERQARSGSMARSPGIAWSPGAACGELALRGL
ncbi:hypothetical protein GGR56DRAFT_129750 [Xylariaceae sp. FL0804]|nr:hypothetical protein GGR56DRAFT_129750 [Xylariaceae sp. FL0804]